MERLVIFGPPISHHVARIHLLKSLDQQGINEVWGFSEIKQALHESLLSPWEENVQAWQDSKYQSMIFEEILQYTKPNCLLSPAWILNFQIHTLQSFLDFEPFRLAFRPLTSKQPNLIFLDLGSQVQFQPESLQLTLMDEGQLHYALFELQTKNQKKGVQITVYGQEQDLLGGPWWIEETKVNLNSK